MPDISSKMAEPLVKRSSKDSTLRPGSKLTNQYHTTSTHSKQRIIRDASVATRPLSRIPAKQLHAPKIEIAASGYSQVVAGDIHYHVYLDEKTATFGIPELSRLLGQSNLSSRWSCSALIPMSSDESRGSKAYIKHPGRENGKRPPVMDEIQAEQKNVDKFDKHKSRGVFDPENRKSLTPIKPCPQPKLDNFVIRWLADIEPSSQARDRFKAKMDKLLQSVLVHAITVVSENITGLNKELQAAQRGIAAVVFDIRDHQAEHIQRYVVKTNDTFDDPASDRVDGIRRYLLTLDIQALLLSYPDRVSRNPFLLAMVYDASTAKSSRRLRDRAILRQVLKHRLYKINPHLSIRHRKACCQAKSKQDYPDWVDLIINDEFSCAELLQPQLLTWHCESEPTAISHVTMDSHQTLDLALQAVLEDSAELWQTCWTRIRPGLFGCVKWSSERAQSPAFAYFCWLARNRKPYNFKYYCHYGYENAAQYDESMFDLLDQGLARLIAPENDVDAGA